MSFSEQESVTIKRLEVAIRNSDMELLKDASYKLHEKFHEGYRFEMLQELSQILAYVSDSDIPSDIKEILCPTIEEILDKETAPSSAVNSDTNASEVNISQNSAQDDSNVSQIHIQDDVTPKNETYPSQVSLELDIPKEEYISDSINKDEAEKKTISSPQINIVPENPSVYAENNATDMSAVVDIAPENPSIYVEEPKNQKEDSYNNQDNIAAEPAVEMPQVVQESLSEQPTQAQTTVEEEKSVEIYEPAYSSEIQEETTSDEENNLQERINAYQEQFGSTNSYDLNIGGYSTEQIVNNIQEDVVRPSEVTEESEPIITNDLTYNHKEQIEEQPQYNESEEKVLEKIAVFYYDKKSTPTCSSTNQIGELSSIIDKIDTDIYDFERLLKTLNNMSAKINIVTTSQSIKLSEFLVQENISFSIPFVTNTSGENSNFEIIPMYGLSNIFRCQNCGSKILSYSFSNKVLSAKCSNCFDVMYPEIYMGDKNINPYYWQRAFGALSGSDTWILFNLPSDDSVIKDFIQTLYQNSKPKRIYLFPENNYYEDFFAKMNPECEIITYQTQEKMIADFEYSESVAQALI